MLFSVPPFFEERARTIAPLSKKCLQETNRKGKENVHAEDQDADGAVGGLGAGAPGGREGILN